MTTEISPRTKTSAEKAAMFRRLDGLYRDLQQRTNNKNDHAIGLIAACIYEGIPSGREIVGIVAHLGLQKQHVGRLWRDNIGHFWHRGGDGFYATLPPLN